MVSGGAGDDSKSETHETDAPKVNGIQAEQTESPAKTESPDAPVNPAPAPQKPKSWASLLSTPASRLAAAAASSDAQSSASTGGSAAAVADARNGSAGALPRAAGSLGEALRAYRVGTTKTITQIEPRGLTNGGNMCYMNSVGDTRSLEALRDSNSC